MKPTSYWAVRIPPRPFFGNVLTANLPPDRGWSTEVRATFAAWNNSSPHRKLHRLHEAALKPDATILVQGA